MIAGYNDRLANVWANQATYSSPQLLGLLDVISRLFGASSARQLPKGVEDVLHKGLYIIANNWGDKLGMLNSGNMFMNMHQAALSGAAGGGYTTLKHDDDGNMSEATNLRRAKALTDAAHDFCFTPSGGVNYANTHGMHPKTFESYAADVAGYL